MQSALEALIVGQLMTFMLVFARVGCVLMLLPGLSDMTVPMQIRLYVALGLSLVLTPLLGPLLGPIPSQPVAFTMLVCREMLFGFFIGLMSQMMLNSVQIAGFMASHATSLSSAFTFNPQMASSQSTVLASLMSLLAVTMLFVTDMHHMLIVGIADSYRVFSATGPVQFGDLTETMVDALGRSFLVGMQMAAPFIVVSIGLFLAMGLVARLVPQIQVFALSVPVQLLTGLALLLVTISAMMLYFMDQYQDFWTGLFSSV